MNAKVTIQDIADALQLSRMTVSKVLNNSPNVSAETRALVLKKAQEMNYKSIKRAVYPAPEAVTPQVKSFAFVMQTAPDSFHIGSQIITQLESEIRQKGYSLTLHIINDADVASLTLPTNLNASQTEAIICLEMFHPEYSRLVCSLGIPVVFIDACADFYAMELPCNLLMMENRSSAYRMLTTLCRKHGLTTMGFVGDNTHCLSFYERYQAFLLAACECGAATEPYGVIADDRLYDQQEWLREQLQQKEKLPELFFCANDVLAQSLIQVLGELGHQVPDDVMVCGFDGIPSRNPVINSLTTIRIPCKELGIYAARLLLRQIQDADAISCSTYLNTEICFRDTAP